MANQFWYAKNGVRNGPVDSDGLQRLVSSGQLLGADLIFSPGWPRWARVDAIPELRAHVVAVPELPPSGKPEVLIETTGKRFKRIMVWGGLLAFIGIVTVFSAMNCEPPRPTQAVVGLLITLCGLLGFMWARVQAWWHHG